MGFRVGINIAVGGVGFVVSLKNAKPLVSGGESEILQPLLLLLLLMASRFRSISKPALSLLQSTMKKRSSIPLPNLHPRGSPSFSRLASLSLARALPLIAASCLASDVVNPFICCSVKK